MALNTDSLPTSATSGPRNSFAVSRLMCTGVVALLLVYFVQPLLPALAVTYDVTAPIAALALTVTTLALVVALAFVAPLSMRLGEMRLLRWSLVTAGGIAVATAWAPDWNTLLALRAAMGAALAAPLALPLSLIRRRDPAGYPRTAALYVAATGLGTALARLVPVPLFTAAGWTTTALLAGTAALCTGAMFFARAEETGPTGTPRFLSDAALALRSLRDPIIAVLCLVSFAAMGAFVGVFNVVGFRAQGPDFASGSSAALIYCLYPLAIGGPLMLARVQVRRSRRTAALIGLVLMVSGISVTLIDSMVAAAIGLGLLTFGFLGANSVTAAWVVDRAGRTGRSSVGSSAAYLTTYYIGSGVVGYLAVALWSDVGWAAVAILSIALLVLAGAGLAAAAHGDGATHGPGSAGAASGG